MMCLFAHADVCKCDHRGCVERLSRHDSHLFGIPTHQITRYGCFACGCRIGYERVRLPGSIPAGFVSFIMFGWVFAGWVPTGEALLERWEMLLGQSLR